MHKDITPRKSLGQHWLTDDTALKQIIKIANLESNDVVLEIGPGMGVLTKLLSSYVNQVIAVELDETLVKYLKSLNLANVDIVHGDILKYDFNVSGNYKIVANIPYYLTGKIMKAVAELKNKPTLVVLLVQKEIAERLSARPGNLSILGLTTQYYFEVITGPIVLSDKFDPPPKVDSQIIKLVPKITKLDENTEKALFRLIKIGFSSKRKTITNNISSGYLLDKALISNMLKEINIEPTRRPQTLDMNEWISILHYLQAGV